jgi:hypothetical protein
MHSKHQLIPIDGTKIRTIQVDLQYRKDLIFNQLMNSRQSGQTKVEF